MYNNCSELGNYEKFKSNLHYIFEMIKYSKDKRKLKNYIETHEHELDSMDSVEVTAAFALLGQTKMVERLLLDVKEDEKEDVKMCVALDEMMRDSELIGEARGMERGIEYGIANSNTLIQILMGLGRLEDLLRSTKDAEYQKQLFREFNIE